MRRSSSTTSRCGASSARIAGVVIPTPTNLRSPTRAIGPCDMAKHAIATVGVGHGDEETARRLVGPRPKLGQRARNARGLEAGKLHGQRLALRRHVQEPLAAVVRSLLLHHVAF